MTIKKYRLVGISENFDTTISKKIILFNLSPVEYNGDRDEYYFNPDSDDNSTFAYIHTQEIEDHFNSNKYEVISMDTNKFNCVLMADEEKKLKKTYLENEYYNKRKTSKTWLINTENIVKENNQLGFKFSHHQCVFFDFGKKYDPLTNRDDIIPSNLAENNDIIENESYIVLSNSNIQFIEKGTNRNITRISGRVSNIVFENNQIKKIEAKSSWATHNNVNVSFEFDSQPLKFLEKTEKNMIITIFGNGTQSPPIRVQFSLMFGKDMGIVRLE